MRPRCDLGRAGLAAILGLVIAWELVGRLDVSMFVPPLSRVAAAWWHLAADGTLARAASSSLTSLVKGFVPAAVLGVVVGLAMGRFATVRYVLDGWVNALMSAPLSALVPVLIALFGVRDTVVAATVFMFSFFVIGVNSSPACAGPTGRSSTWRAPSSGRAGAVEHLSAGRPAGRHARAALGVVQG